MSPRRARSDSAGAMRARAWSRCGLARSQKRTTNARSPNSLLEAAATRRGGLKSHPLLK
jgi:hypothetical protein